ncbi:MAG: DUF5677 domain-containing protein [Bacillota bacterium]|nr:DUF5677 domain-containing protein [Bacillota bacterium]
MDFRSLEKDLLEQIKSIVLKEMKAGRTVKEDKIEEMLNLMYSKKMIQQYAKPLYDSFISNAPEMYEEHRLEKVEFEARLQQRWLKAFYGLESVITISEEAGMGIIDEYVEDKKREDGTYRIPIEYDVVFKLHAKSVVVSKEILTLLQAGYSDAGISRWRTLHEISVILGIFTFYLQNNEKMAKELAIRFYKRSIIEEYKIERNEMEVDTKDFRSLSRENEKIKEEYGEKFIYENYEWLRPIFKKSKKRIFFSDLERKNKNTNLSKYYKMANSQIHSTSFGLYDSFGDMGNSNTGAVYGPSNYGLSIPGQLTIISMISCTTSLLSLNTTLDKLTLITTLKMFFDQYSTIFDDIQRKIEEDEVNINEK